MKIQLIALSLCVLASTNLVKGQGFTPSENKHGPVRVLYGHYPSTYIAWMDVLDADDLAK